jgi:hypothetical protein
VGTGADAMSIDKSIQTIEPEKRFKLFLDLSFLSIGRANVIGKDGTYCLGEYQSDEQNPVKFNKNYFAGGGFLKSFVLNDNRNYKEQINDATAYEIFKHITKDVAILIQNREAGLDKTFEKYLKPEDYTLAKKLIDDDITKSKGEFRVVFITDLIELVNLDQILIGRGRIRKIDNNYMSQWPETIPTKSQKSLLGFGLTDDTKDKFLEQHKNHVAIEIDVHGYHYCDEKSAVIVSAIRDIKLIFSFLLMCRRFLSSVSEDAISINTKETKTNLFWAYSEPVGFQEYYLTKQNDIAYLKIIDFTEKIRFASEVVVITKEVSEQIEKRCCIAQFNKLVLENTELSNKIRLGFDWFLKASLEKDMTDEAIALFISLESLLASGSSQNTETLGANLAIMLNSDSEKRFKYKEDFKKKTYPLRNKIMHHGELVSFDKNHDELVELRSLVAWALYGILYRLDEIKVCGTHGNVIFEYFDRLKLKNPWDVVTKHLNKQKQEG